MKIDLTDAMAVDYSDRRTEVPFTMDAVSFQRSSFPVLEKSPVILDIHHEKDGLLQVRAAASLTVSIPCDRCLTPVSCGFSVEAERKLDLLGEDRPSYVEGSMLDVDGLIFHELLLHWPAKVLCRESCKGLCPVCGSDLNQGECGCDRQVLDPRMAAIQDVFNKFQSK